MKSRSPRPSDKKKLNFPRKQKQPRPLILAMMLTGVLVIETYPTAMETIAQTLNDVLPTSQTVVAERAISTPKPSPETEPAIDPPTQKPVADRSTCDWSSICDITAEPGDPVVPDLLFVSRENQLKPILPDIPNPFPSEKLPRTTLTQASADLPADVATAVREDLARREGIAPKQVEIVEVSPQMWPDTCLGLADPDEFCGQMLVDGWRVKVSDGDRDWTYRTNGDGNTLRLEPREKTRRIPPPVAEAVFDATSRRLGFPRAALRITDAEAKTWPDGCLGLSEPGTFCTQALIPGWRVTVSDGTNRWVYRSDETGSVVKLDREASRTGKADPLHLLKMSPDRLLSAWTKQIAFQSDATYGIAETTYDTLEKSDKDPQKFRDFSIR